MYQISETINDLSYTKLQVKKLFHNGQAEVLCISLEEGNEFPEHTSPRDALLVMLDGAVSFHINDTEFVLQKNQTFDFPANEPHWVKARADAKFLIVR
ncbi:cupin domain-containing protein [Spongiimicrobium sp. 3-5]|uniref:cupin domain-containing protein n=1 Tax=Spongiimicrobium sp. 3-5 TaxID=3332596 RepID=UPI00397FDE0F